MPNRTLLWLTAVVIGAALNASPAPAKDKPAGPSDLPVMCSQLATDPALGLEGNPIIKPGGADKSYCQVDVLYGESPEQNVNIRVGLPLNSMDGGTGGIQGAWNG